MENEMYSKLVEVTPQLAQEMLKKSEGNPRWSGKVTDRNRVAIYAKDITDNKWEVTPQGIVFDVDGVLKDGHHRLAAIVKADKPVKLYITYNAPESTSSYDRGMPRTTIQRLRALGVPDELRNTRTKAVCILYYYITKGNDYSKTLTDNQIAEFINNDQIILSQACRLSNISSGHQILQNVDCRFAFYSALHCGVSYETIERFANIVASGFSTCEEECTAILARNYILTKKSRQKNESVRCSAYVQTCLFDFVEGTKRTKAYKKPKLIYTVQWLGKDNLVQSDYI